MDDICWGTKVKLSRRRLRVRRWFGSQTAQTRFPISYYYSAFGLPNMIVVEYRLMSKPSRLDAQSDLILDACYICRHRNSWM
jgi:hypothetical protein